jgi:hypothetical protein
MTNPTTPPWHQAVDIGRLSLVLANGENEPPSDAELEEVLLTLKVIVALRRKRRELGLPDEAVRASA